MQSPFFFLLFTFILPHAHHQHQHRNIDSASLVVDACALSFSFAQQNHLFCATSLYCHLLAAVNQDHFVNQPHKARPERHTPPHKQKHDEDQLRGRPLMNNSNSVAGSAQGQAESETQNSTLQHGSDGSSIGSAPTHDAATHLLNKPLVPGPQESYSPWDMPPIIQPATSIADTRPSAGCKGFSSNLTTWPHFRSKPHPTISVPATPTTLAGRSNFDMAAPSTPPHSSFSNPDDSDNAMVTPTFGSSNSGYSRRNSAISVMALDTPPPLSLMDLESSSASSLSGSSFGSSGLGHGLPGPSMRPGESVFHGHGYPFPLFGMRNDVNHSISRRSSRTNSVSMESRHVRKPSEDTNMSDGGNNSGSERSRRHSPAVVPFERSVRRSALLVCVVLLSFTTRCCDKFPATDVLHAYYSNSQNQKSFSKSLHSSR